MVNIHIDPFQLTDAFHFETGSLFVRHGTPDVLLLFKTLHHYPDFFSIATTIQLFSAFNDPFNQDHSRTGIWHEFRLLLEKYFSEQTFT